MASLFGDKCWWQFKKNKNAARKSKNEEMSKAEREKMQMEYICISSGLDLLDFW